LEQKGFPVIIDKKNSEYTLTFIPFLYCEAGEELMRCNVMKRAWENLEKVFSSLYLVSLFSIPLSLPFFYYNIKTYL